ncbi:hypothetical protein RDABS01_032176 [Bienertia sinuspersici]
MAKTRRQKTHQAPYTGEDGQSTQSNRKGNTDSPKPNAITGIDNSNGEGDDTNRDDGGAKPQQGESQTQENDKSNLNSWIEVMTGKGTAKQDHDITKSTETPMVTIDMDDIEDEITYWSSAMICFVLGANPPLPVMSGFCNRIWGKKGLDKVSMVGRGLFLVRFNTIEQCNNALTGDPYFFDYKPLIMKQWSPDIELHKESVKTVPIWVRMPHLELKYWGQGCLHKLGDIIGTTLKIDNVTMNKDRLSYARILVAVELDKELPDYIRFQNEKGLPVQQYIEYEWRPTYCTVCKRYGHPSDKCNKKTTKQWQPKKTQGQQPLKENTSNIKDAATEQKAEEKGHKESQGFSPVQRKRKTGAQYIHCKVQLMNGDSFFLTSIYGFNGKTEREPLWEGLQKIHSNIGNSPWCVTGNFNAVMSKQDRIGAVIFPSPKGKKPFRFYNYWSQMPDFQHLIQQEWNQEVRGCTMFQIVEKLKGLKGKLKRLQAGDIQASVKAAKEYLEECQTQLHKDPHSAELAHKEIQAN